MNSLLRVIYIAAIVISAIACKGKAPETMRKLASRSANPKAPLDTIAILSKGIKTENSLDPIVKLPSSQFSPFIEELDSSIKIIGILQSSGLQESSNLKIKAKYQLISFQRSFYLVTELDLERYWGKCIEAQGQLVLGWDLGMIDYSHGAYGRIPMELVSFKELVCDSCSWLPYPKEEIKSYTYRDQLSGYIARNLRPDPDIPWDFQLKLDSPIPHPDDPKNQEMNISEMIVYPNIQLGSLNKIIDDSLHIMAIGLTKGGYNESVVFKTDSIIVSK